MEPWTPLIHDIAITKVTSSKTVVGQGYSMSMNVTAEDQGDFPETFSVTTYANETIIATLANIFLTRERLTKVNFTWNIIGFAKGNCTITAYTTPVPDETDTADNTLIDGWVFVTVPGDVDGDRDVDIFDIVRIASVYNEKCPSRTRERLGH